jgi:hypothetical protein
MQNEGSSSNSVQAHNNSTEESRKANLSKDKKSKKNKQNKQIKKKQRLKNSLKNIVPVSLKNQKVECDVKNQIKNLLSIEGKN